MLDCPEEPESQEAGHVVEDRRDSAELSEFGYQQQLTRSMGAFSSFAVSFSLISVTTGIFAGFSTGIQSAGPSVIWSWLVVMAGQLLTAMVLAELARHIPLSGYGYQWSSRLVNAQFGYFVGWILLLQFLTGFPGVCKAFADYFHGFLRLDMTFGGGLSWLTPPRLTVVIISTIALIHIFGIRLVSLVNDLGVIAEISGTVLVTAILLAVFAFRQPNWFEFLLDRTDRSGNPAGIAGFSASLLLGAWCLTGFEAAADLAEETHNPRAVVPRAVILSELTAGIFGFLMLVAFVLAIDRGPDSLPAHAPLNLLAIQQSETPLLDMIRGRLGSAAGGIAMLIVFVSVFACGIASLATTTRLVFSMARDNMLPFSRQLQRVHPIYKTPRNAILAVWIGTSAVVLAIERLDWITSISTVAGYLGYCGILMAALIGLRGRPMGSGYSLGRWRGPIAVAAIIWSLFVVAAITIPALLQGKYLPAAATGAALALGTALFLALISGRLRRGEAGPPPAGWRSGQGSTSYGSEGTVPHRSSELN